MIRKTLLKVSFIIIFLSIISCTKEPENVAISSDGVEIKFDVHGEGDPTLVFVHGWCCDRKYWDDQVPHFSKKYKVVTIDLVGHGDSGIDRKTWSMEAFGRDVLAVVDKIGIDKTVLIGHSMGGPVILEAARLMPESVIGLVGADTFSRISGPIPQKRIDELMAPLKTNFSEATADYVRRNMFTPNSDSTFIEKIVTDMAAAPPKVGLSEAAAFLKYDMIPAFQEIKVPIYCINASRDQKNVEDARKFSPSFEIVAMSNVGHFVMMEDPETFNQLLEEIIQGFVNKTH